MASPQRPSRPTGPPSSGSPSRPLGPSGPATPGRGATPEANIPGVPVYAPIDAPELHGAYTPPGADAPPPPAAAMPEARGYANAGVLTADEIISGEADKYTWLDPKVIEVTTFVQQALVAAGRDGDLEKSRSDPRLRAEMSEEIDRLALQYMLKERSIRGQEGKIVIATVVNDIVGLGPLEPLWQDPGITEVIVNGPTDVYVEQKGRLVKAKACRFRSQEHLLEVCQRILAPLNRKVDVRDPLADGRLPDGSRVNVVHTALAPKGPLLTIRRFPEKSRSMVDLVGIGSMDPDMATLIATLVKNRASMLVVGGTGTGKSLDVETPIPTPDGFKRMGDLCAGDTVFDEHGEPTRVLAAYDVQHGRDCLEVLFSDGSSIVADTEHLWLTETRSARRATGRRRNMTRSRKPVLSEQEAGLLTDLLDTLPADAAVATRDVSDILGWDTAKHGRWYPVAATLSPVGQRTRPGSRSSTPERLFLAHDLIRAALDRWSRPWHDQRHLSEYARVTTTVEIRSTLRTARGHANHSIPTLSRPATYPTRDLPLPPRILGLWLGDGTAATARFSTDDIELLDEFRAMGWNVRHIENYDYAITGGLQRTLRCLGVINNKHIPDSYLFSSEAQRRALLSGLLDTDGGAGKVPGAVEFYSSNKRLAEQVRTLAASLGYRPTLRSKNVRLNGRDLGLAYTVAFQGRGDEFGLNRKTDTWTARRATSGRQGDRHTNRYIVDVRPVPSRPVRCIRVANDSHLFLAGETYIATHNTTLLNALSAAIPNSERVVTIEDSLELRLDGDKHVAAMEARPPDATGGNAVTIRHLVKNALRMRPDRIIVGEIRDSAALDMLQACNTGHEGSMSTVHANGPDEAISRLAVMVAQGGEIPAGKVDWLVGSALDLIVMARRYEDGSRRVSGVYEVPDVSQIADGQSLRTIPLWEWEQTGTGDDGMLLGRYVKRNDISEHLSKARGLDLAAPVSWEELLVMCHAQPAPEPAPARTPGAGSRVARPSKPAGGKP